MFVTNMFFKEIKVQSLTLFFAHVCYNWSKVKEEKLIL